MALHTYGIVHINGDAMNEDNNDESTTGQSAVETSGEGAIDPRLVTIARAIGRLIARERFAEHEAAAAKTIWTVSEARGNLSKIIDRAQTRGAQTVTCKGRAVAVIVSPDEWERTVKRPTGNLAEFFAASPLRESELTIERAKDTPPTR